MNLYSWFLIEMKKHSFVSSEYWEQISIAFISGQGAGILPEEDQVQEGQIDVILSCSDPPKVFDGIPPLKSWFKCDLKVEFLSEVVMGKIMKGGKVVLLLSGRWSSFKLPAALCLTTCVIN